MLNATGNGYTDDVIPALNSIIGHNEDAGQGVPVENIELINMSFGVGENYAPGECPTQDFLAQSWLLAYLRITYGTVAFAAAGNNGSKSGLDWPACDPSVVSAAASYDATLPTSPLTWLDQNEFVCTDQASAPDQVTCFSQSSIDLDVVAPGSEIFSTWPFGYPAAYRHGTSQATPHAVGVAALLKEAMPGLTAQQIEDRLKATGKLVTDDLHDGDSSTNRTKPRVDARVALPQVTDDDLDYDQDGCKNGREFQTAVGSQSSGGLRNPLDFWDFFDVWTQSGGAWIRNKAVGLAEINAIAARFAQTGTATSVADALTPPTAANNYHAAYDRSAAPPGANPWDLGPANGAIGLSEVYWAAAQFGHYCQ